jgi:hypothetical protein
MSAFGGKADMRSLLAVKRTSLVAADMSAFDPKQTSDRFLGTNVVDTM